MPQIVVEKKHRRPYWRRTKVQMATSLILPGLIALLLWLGDVDLQRTRILAFPLGYFLACHGVVLLAIVAVARFVAKQDDIDRIHGAHENI